MHSPERGLLAVMEIELHTYHVARGTAHGIQNLPLPESALGLPFSLFPRLAQQYHLYSAFGLRGVSLDIMDVCHRES